MGDDEGSVLGYTMSSMWTQCIAAVFVSQVDSLMRFSVFSLSNYSFLSRHKFDERKNDDVGSARIGFNLLAARWVAQSICKIIYSFPFLLAEHLNNAHRWSLCWPNLTIPMCVTELRWHWVLRALALVCVRRSHCWSQWLNSIPSILCDKELWWVSSFH